MSKGRSQNPYERWDLDPDLDVAALTAAFRARLHATDDEAERAALRDAWEALTKHPAERAKWALATYPSDVDAPSMRPPRPRLPKPPTRPTFRERWTAPSVRSALGSGPVSVRVEMPARAAARALPAIEDDPLFGGLGE